MADPATLNAIAVARRIAERLEEEGLPYGIGGALALGAWKAPRSTRDVDLSIFVHEPELPRAFDALERAGVMLDRANATRDVARIGSVPDGSSSTSSSRATRSTKPCGIAA